MIGIRELRLEDENSVRNLFKEGMIMEDPEMTLKGHHEYIERSLKDDLENICQSYCLKPNTNFWVAVDTSKAPEFIAGFVGLRRSKKDYAELCRLQVHPQYRRYGIATQLLKTLENFVLKNNEKVLTLETITLHRKAMRFYEAKGFVKNEEIRLPNEITVVSYIKHLQNSPTEK